MSAQTHDERNAVGDGFGVVHFEDDPQPDAPTPPPAPVPDAAGGSAGAVRDVADAASASVEEALDARSGDAARAGSVRAESGEGALEDERVVSGAGDAGVRDAQSGADASAPHASTPRRGRPKAFGDKRQSPLRMALAAGLACVLVALAVGIVVSTTFAGHGEESLGNVRAEGEPDASAQGVSPGAADDSSSQSSTASNSEADISKARMMAESALLDLANDEDGRFTEFVQELMDSYDSENNAQQSYGLSDIGITAQELSACLRDGFSCEVSEVDAYGDTAWIEVSATSRSLSDVAESFASSLSDGGEGAIADAVAAEDEDAYKAYLKDAFLASVSAASPKTASVSITLERVDGVWVLPDSSVEYLLGTVWYNQE